MERMLDAPIDKVWNFLVTRAKRTVAGRGSAQPRSRVNQRRQRRADEKAPPVPAVRRRAPAEVAHREDAGASPAGHDLAGRQPACPQVLMSARGDQTHLTLVHSKLPRREDMLNVAGGWHAHLDVLEDVLAERAPRPFWSDFGEKEAAYDRLIPAT
jgi:hypothetical protein